MLEFSLNSSMDLQGFGYVLRNNQVIGHMAIFFSFKNIFGSAEMFNTLLFFGNDFRTFL